MPRESFAILSGALDKLEEMEASSAGAPDYTDAIRAIESVILGFDAQGEGLRWKFRLLVRAIRNEWDATEVGPICASILAEVRAIAKEVVE